MLQFRVPSHRASDLCQHSNDKTLRAEAEVSPGLVWVWGWGVMAEMVREPPGGREERSLKGWGRPWSARLRGVYLPQRSGHGEPWKDMEPAGGGRTRVARGLLSVWFVVVPVSDMWTQASVTCFLHVPCRWNVSPDAS